MVNSSVKRELTVHVAGNSLSIRLIAISTSISETLVGMVRTLGPTDSCSSLSPSNLAWVQNVEGNSVWCDSINYVCRVSGFEGNKSILTSHSGSLCSGWLPMSTVNDGLSRNIIPTTGHVEGESDLRLVSVKNGMPDCIHPGPDQNTLSCIYSDNSFRLSTGISNSLKGGKFGCSHFIFPNHKVVNNISGFSSHIIQAVHRKHIVIVLALSL